MLVTFTWIAIGDIFLACVSQVNKKVLQKKKKTENKSESDISGVCCLIKKKKKLVKYIIYVHEFY